MKIAGVDYIAVRKYDTESEECHVVGLDGMNYGAWRTPDSFITARKRFLKLKPGETTNELIAVPLGSAVRLSVRHY